VPIGTPCQPEVCTWRPIAHTKPANSRATATTALVFITRRAKALELRVQLSPPMQN